MLHQYMLYETSNQFLINIKQKIIFTYQMAYYSSYYPEIEAARLEIQGRIRSLQDRLYLRREVTDELQKQQLQYSIQNLYKILRQTIESQTNLHNQLRNLKQEVILDKKYQKKLNNIELARHQANERALLLQNRFRNFNPLPQQGYIPYSDPLLHYSVSNSAQRERNQLRQKLERQYQQNLQRSLRSKEYSNTKKQNYDKLRYEDLQEQKYVSHSNSNSKYDRSNLYPSKRQIKENASNLYQRQYQKNYETPYNYVNNTRTNNNRFQKDNQQKRIQQQKQKKNQYIHENYQKQEKLNRNYQRRDPRYQLQDQKILERQRQNLSKLNTSYMRDEIAKAKNEQLSKSRLQRVRNQNVEQSKNQSQTPQNFANNNNKSMIERSLEKYKRYQPVNDSGTKSILKKSAQKQRLKHDQEAQTKIKQSAIKKIQNRMMQSWALYQDSNFKNTKHQKQHLFNTYNKQFKFRKEIKQKIEFQPIVQKKYGLHIEEK